MDLSKFGSSENLHAGFYALLHYFNEHNSLPKYNTDTTHILENSKKLLSLQGEFELNSDLIKFQLKHCNNEFAAISGIVGGIAAQEIIKFTGK